MKKITTDIKEAVKVRFLKPIFEEDFIEKGMKAWLTDIEWESEYDCYKLYFDLTDFEKENDKYLKECYYQPSKATKELGVEKEFYTAKEAGFYKNKTFAYFSADNSFERNDEVFQKEILEYLEVIE